MKDGWTWLRTPLGSASLLPPLLLHLWEGGIQSRICPPAHVTRPSLAGKLLESPWPPRLFTHNHAPGRAREASPLRHVRAHVGIPAHGSSSLPPEHSRTQPCERARADPGASCTCGRAAVSPLHTSSPGVPPALQLAVPPDRWKPQKYAFFFVFTFIKMASMSS